MAMTLIYAPPSHGKTLAALAAFPDAAIATTKAESISEPAKLYGLDIPDDRITVVSSAVDLKKFASANKDRPKIIDDLSDLLEKEHGPIDKAMGSPDSYGELNTRYLPLLRALSERAAYPTIITAWAKDPAIVKDLTGEKNLQPGGWAAPGAKMRSTLPGLCTHYLRIRPQEAKKSAWAFEFQMVTNDLWASRSRAPASVPAALPLALSEIYRASGYECAPMFADQEKVREAAVKLLEDDDTIKARDALSKIFVRAVNDGANPYAVSYAVTEAQVRVALRKHAEDLTSTLADSFF